MSTEVIQFIQRPGRADAMTDFPAIAFRSVVQNSSAFCASGTSDQPAKLDRRET
jgi:hypothetical protein